MNDTSTASPTPWDLWRALKALPVPDPPDPREAVALFRQYAHQEERLARPSLLHSQMLRQACNWAPGWREFPAFVKWWNPANLRPEDRLPPKIPPPAAPPCNPPAPARSAAPPSLVERLAKALCLNVKAFPDPAVADWAAALLVPERKTAPRHSWLPFHHAKLLIAAGRPTEARRDVAALVRFKPREFWAWAELAATFTPGESASRIACLCRAVQCRTKPEFLINVRLELGLLLVETGQFPEARYELEAVKQVREANKWKIPTALSTALTRPDVQAANPPAHNQSLCQRHAEIAERLVWNQKRPPPIDSAARVGGSEKSQPPANENPPTLSTSGCR
ncbi:MAG: hypothetical protein R6X19_06835 [Kiritimatiellia bacterium]